MSYTDVLYDSDCIKYMLYISHSFGLSDSDLEQMRKEEKQDLQKSSRPKARVEGTKNHRRHNLQKPLRQHRFFKCLVIKKIYIILNKS